MNIFTKDMGAGTNKNTNGFIWQYVPKGTYFNQVTDERIEQVMDRLNNRPRKTRENKSPNELFWGGKLIYLPHKLIGVVT